MQEIGIGFIGELLESVGINTILGVPDQFTKIQDYIPAMTISTAEHAADSNSNTIWKLCGLPRHIVSDHSLQFAVKFLKDLNCKLKINLHLSTANHLQMDELRDQAVQTHKQYLRMYCLNRHNR